MLKNPKRDRAGHLELNDQMSSQVLLAAFAHRKTGQQPRASAFFWWPILVCRRSERPLSAMLPQRVDENLIFRKQSERLWKPASVRSGRKLEIDRLIFPSTSFGPLDAHTAMKYYLNSLSGRCVMVKTSVFQTDDYVFHVVSYHYMLLFLLT